MTDNFVSIVKVTTGIVRQMDSVEVIMESVHIDIAKLLVSNLSSERVSVSYEIRDAQNEYRWDFDESKWVKVGEDDL